MADKRISELNEVTLPANEAVLPIVQSGQTQKVTYQNLKQEILGNTTPSTGKFTSVTTPTVTTPTSSLSLSTTNTPFSLIVREDTSGSNALTGSLIVEGPKSTLGRVAVKSSNALFLATSSTNSMYFQTNANTNIGVDGATQLTVTNTTSAVNNVQITGATTTNRPTISSQGSDTNVGLNIQSKNSGAMIFTRQRDAVNSSQYLYEFVGGLNADSNGGAFWRGLHLGAPNYTVSGSNRFPRMAQYFELQSATNPTYTNAYYAIGNATGLNIEGVFSNESGGGWTFKNASSFSSDISFRIATPLTTDRNYLQVAGAATNLEPLLSAQGSDTNISIAFQPKGTGSIDLASGTTGVNISNGTSITGITLSNGGGGYTSAPALTISAPQIPGGVQAVGQTRVGLWGQGIASGGSGYTVGDILTYVGGTLYQSVPPTQAIVTSVSGGVITGIAVYNNQFGTYTTTPTSPVTVTGGTGTGATINATWTVYGVAVTTAGSGYVEQPTLTFPAPPSGTTASAYATVGSATTIKSLHTQMNFYAANSGIGMQIYDATGSSGASGGYWRFAQNYSGYGTMISSAGGLISSAGANEIQFRTNSAAQEQFRVSHTASAVNYVQVTGSATGSGGTISSQGSDANIPIFIQSKGTGWVEAKSNGRTAFVMYNPSSSAVNYLQVEGKTSGNAPTILANGSDTDISLGLTSKGNGGVVVTSSTTGVNGVLYIAGGTSGLEGGELRLNGSTGYDNSVIDNYTGLLRFFNSNGAQHRYYAEFRGDSYRFSLGGTANTVSEQFRINHTASAVNNLQTTGSATGTSPNISAQGSDSNISINLIPKGTGTVQQNSVPLALSTHKYHAFVDNTYYHDRYEQGNYFRLFTQNAVTDIVRYGNIHSVEYYDYGTSTWTNWSGGTAGVQNLLDGNETTGMDVAHANRTFRFVVSANTWPTSVLIMLQSTWSAITYTPATVTIASGTSSTGPFTTRATMTFNSANSGSEWGMHAHYKSNALHSGDGFYQVTIDITDWVDSGSYVVYPLRNFCIFSNYQSAGKIVPYTTAYDKYTNFIGGIRTPADQNGSLDLGRYNGQDSVIDTGSNATGLTMRTKYNTQFRVANTDSAVNYIQVTGASTTNRPRVSFEGSDTNIGGLYIAKGSGGHSFCSDANAGVVQFAIARTASAVNYVQVTGSATGSGVGISAQGSDTNIAWDARTKGSGAFEFSTGGTYAPQFQISHTASAVNRLRVTGSETGASPVMSAQGNDTNINITLTPKGTGRVQFGTHTATADTAISGYIEILDAGGTVRKLAVIS